MGGTISTLRIALRTFFGLIRSYEALNRLIKQSPGLPHPKPTPSFWLSPPSDIAHHQSPFTKYADVVIIGSGITGASVARRLLESEVGEGIRITMLDARETCGGATGRNGGHINPVIYQDYPSLVQAHGKQTAAEIIRFRLSHFKEIQKVAVEDDLVVQSQLREVEACDVYFGDKSWNKAKESLKKFKTEMPEEAAAFHEFERDEAIARFGLSGMISGCISQTAGAVHPYQLVTGILSRLLQVYSDNFHLITHTPCTSISAPSESPYYTVHTPQGDILTQHIVHCTNAYVSHLLEPMRTKIVPLRGTMSAQKPGPHFPGNGNRSFVFWSSGYEYLTQLPTGSHEVMFGGGLAHAQNEGMTEIGVVNDGAFDVDVAARLAGVLPFYFKQDVGGLDKMWSGIIGLSADKRPWVGRVPARLSGRQQGTVSRCAPLAQPGEWISAGYSGEGMVHAWLCGKAVADMILGQEYSLPQVMLTSVRRWQKAKAEDLL